MKLLLFSACLLIGSTLQTELGPVDCPNAELVGVSTDEALESLVRPQAQWAIDYCGGN